VKYSAAPPASTAAPAPIATVATVAIELASLRSCLPIALHSLSGKQKGFESSYLA
jgi:hypothetical protein